LVSCRTKGPLLSSGDEGIWGCGTRVLQNGEADSEVERKCRKHPLGKGLLSEHNLLLGWKCAVYGSKKGINRTHNSVAKATMQ